ncbi:MAG: FecR domain-containing protein [Sphingomonas sp.]
MTVGRLAEASAWRVRLAEGDAESNATFEDWIAAHPENRAAWDQVEHGWNRVGALASAPELLAMRSEALDRARRRAGVRRGGYGRVAAIAASFAVIFAAGLIALLFAMRPGPEQPEHLTIATASGERRVVTLADGSHVSLDSGSELRVAFTEGARRLELVRGQARFKVAKDAARIFSVKARDRVVVATGTDFNIDLSAHKVAITLIEGNVTVLDGDARNTSDVAPPPARRPAPVSLVAGQQLVVAPAAAPRVQPASLDRTSAWERGQLMFEDEPLAAVAERVSRYTPHPITVDPGIGGIRISGVFQTGDAATFVEVVTRYLPVRATRAENGTIRLRPKE